MPKKISEAGVYNVSVGENAGSTYDGDDDADFSHDELAELDAYMDGLSESVPKGAPESDFAAPPKGLYVGDALHAAKAVQAVSHKGLMGNRASKGKREAPGAKSKIAAAIRKFYKGDEQKYYLSWLRTGSKPDKKPAAKMSEIAIATPHWSVQDEENFPDPPITPGVNIDRLTESDRMNNRKPLFVTRPLAIEGELSDNNLRYTAEMLNEIYQQVLSKRPPGRLGHVSENNRSWEVPPDSCLWVGVMDVPDDKIFGKRTVYGKAYIYPNAALHEMIEKRSAAGTPLSNSIWGLADLVDNGDGTVSSASTDIESIDFVSPERAALKALGGEFVVTSEMEVNPMTEHEDAAADLDLFKKAVASIKPEAIHEALHEAGHAHEVATHHVRMHEAGGKCAGGPLHEMFTREGRAKMAESHLREEATPEETYKMLDEAHRAHVAECYMKEMGNSLSEAQRAKEEETKKSVSEMTNQMTELRKQISELQQINKAHERADFERALDAQVDTYFAAVSVHTDKGREVIANLKRQMRKGSLAEMAGMKDGQVIDNIAVACDKVWTEDTKALTEMAYAGLQGPAAVVNAPRNPNAGNRLGVDPSTGFFTPEFMKDARSAANGALRRKGGK